jgi:serine/threonine protein kinase
MDTTDLLARIEKLKRTTVPLRKKKRVKFTKNIRFVEIPKKKIKLLSPSVDKSSERQEPMKNSSTLTLPANESRGPLKVKKIKKIGSGGYGEVFQVELLNKDDAPKYFPKTKLALKVMTDLDSNRAFEYEQKIMDEIVKEYGKKCAPHILCYFDISQDEEGRFYLLSEMMDGDIYDYTRKNKMDIDQKMKLLLQLSKQALNGLKELFALGLLHRDIKAENILFKKDPKGNLKFKLIDFGLSCIKNNPELRCGKGIAGTSGFIDPVILMKVYTKKSDEVDEIWDETNDIYSMAVAFYEILFGEYVNKSVREVIESRDVNRIIYVLNNLYDEANQKIELLKQMYTPRSKEFKLLNMISRNIRPFERKQTLTEVMKSLS